MKFFVESASASGEDEEPNNEVPMAAFRAAMGLFTALSLTHMELTARNSKLVSFLTEVVKRLLDSAVTTIAGTKKTTQKVASHDD